MQIKAVLDERKHAHILGLFMCDQFEEPKRIRFIVDTGCTTTTILPLETARLEIECDLLPHSNPTETATTSVRPRSLINASVIFLIVNANNETIPMISTFNRMDVLPQRIKNILVRFLEGLIKILIGDFPYGDEGSEQISHNLLGMDFLQKFRDWTFTDDELILSTDEEPNEIANVEN